MKKLDFTNTQVASSETARNINRGVVLNLIRKKQPISRAGLARVSGLQRSTVSLIIEQLIREQWVVKGPVGRLPRGRRPTYLRLNDRRAILVADVRPTQITVAVADVNGRFLSQERMPTPADAQTAVRDLSARFRQFMQTHSSLVFEGVGISVPGRFDDLTERVVFAPNLHWSDFDLKGPIERSLRMRVEMENAANACVLAEAWFGHAEHVRDIVAITVSEGIGAGIFINGQLMRGWNGMGGEFGHVSINPDGPRCACGGQGCWELYASNTAALRYYQESSETSSGLSFDDLLALADGGDALALKALDKMAQALGKGMRMIVAGLAPEEIVVVGEFARHWQRVGRVIEEELATGVLAGKPPKVRPAAEPSMARLRGTVALVLKRHFGASTSASSERKSA